jgi:4-oxalocrotonate tautomerase
MNGTGWLSPVQRPFSASRFEMPYINIKVTREGVTKRQKQELITGATQLVIDVLGKNPLSTIVVIDEVDTDNWGIAGEQVTERRRKGEE